MHSDLFPQYANNLDELPSGGKELDLYKRAATELFYISHPDIKKGNVEEDVIDQWTKKEGVDAVWVFLPWKNLKIRIPSEDWFFTLRTARNRNIISPKEQMNYRNLTLGIVGLSIGSAALTSLVYSGGPKNIKLADYDEIEFSNLNRMMAGIHDVGKNKSVVCAQRSWEIDPYLNLDIWEKGVTRDTLEEFIVGRSPLGVFVDAMDSLDLKIMSRLICREHGVPVLMATSNGDQFFLDVERYDLEPERDIFHGLLGKDISAEVIDTFATDEWLKMALKLVVEENLTSKMKESLGQVGKTIAGVPQLITTINMGAAAISYAVRSIANKEELHSGRYVGGIVNTKSHFNTKKII